jgi:sugar/nucleoside kinase (ribokinase family)
VEYGAASKITAKTVPTHQLTPETIVHLSPMRPTKVDKIVKKIREASPETKISINTWKNYIKKTRKNRNILKNLAETTDFFILNDSEAKALTKTESISTALTLLKAKMLIITLGEYGAIIKTENTGTQIIPALKTPTKNTVDTTGAGDTWCGAFLATYKQTNNLMKSVTTASILSSIKCTGWNYQKLLKLKLTRPDDIIQYIIAIKEGALQKKIPDYTTQRKRD